MRRRSDRRNPLRGWQTFAFALTGLFLLSEAARGATWYTQGTGNKTIDTLSHWTDHADGTVGTSPAAVPSTGDTDTWVIRGNTRVSANPSGETWYGQTVMILDQPANDGELQLWNEDFTVRDVILDGGVLNVGGNKGTSHTLWGKTLTLNSGIIGLERVSTSWVSRYEFTNYTGSGEILIQGRHNGAPNTAQLGHVRFSGGGDFSTFMGSFQVHAGMTLEFGYDITEPTFGITVVSGGGTYPGLYNLLNHVSVTSLTLGSESIAPGAYSYGDFAPSQQAFLVDSGGTIRVGGSPPTGVLLIVK